MAGIYIHIPFCRQACVYCDFHFSVSLHHKEKMVNAILNEIDSRREYLKEDTSIDSIYFGGGTPSLLDSEEINSIIQTIDQFFVINPDVEITLEANPDDLTIEKIKSLRSTRINRLSIGVQSFFDKDLKFMSRIHTAAVATECILKSFDLGFENISIDLIYGTPTLNNENWIANLKKAEQLPIQHLSSYALTVEPKTVLSKKIKNKEILPVDENMAREQFDLLTAFAKDNNFDHYEISNLCRNNKVAIHNTGYWKAKHYLGAGPSAHSYNGISRQWNMANNALYTKAIENGETTFEIEILSEQDKYNEYIMTGLRTKWGVDINFISKNFSEKLSNQFIKKTAQLVMQKKLLRKENIFIVQDNFKFVADTIISDLFFEEEKNLT